MTLMKIVCLTSCRRGEAEDGSSFAVCYDVTRLSIAGHGNKAEYLKEAPVQIVLLAPNWTTKAQEHQGATCSFFSADFLCFQNYLFHYLPFLFALVSRRRRLPLNRFLGIPLLPLDLRAWRRLETVVIIIIQPDT